MPENLRGKLGLGLFIYEEALKNLIFTLFKSSPTESKTSHCPVSYPLKKEEPEGGLGGGGKRGGGGAPVTMSTIKMQCNFKKKEPEGMNPNGLPVIMFKPEIP